MAVKLEKYRGTKSRYTCPSCKSRHSFVRYIGDDGNYLSDDVGRCNRETKCGYHYKPKEYFAYNPSIESQQFKKEKKPITSNYGFAKADNARHQPESKKPVYVPNDILLRTLGDYEQNSFVEFLLNLFPEDVEKVEKAVKDYFIGTTKNGRTIFWQIDARRNIRTGKIIVYDATTGKRSKNVKPNWVHAILKKSGYLKEDFELRQCFFGEHLLTGEKQKTVAVVEAEKTAVVASIYFPELNWLAVGSKQSLKAEKLHRLGRRKVVLYPDADGFELWQQIAADANRQGLTVKLSNLIEDNSTDEQRLNGYDLADYLIDQKTKINQ